MKTEYGEIRIFPTREIDARIVAAAVFENQPVKQPLDGAEHIIGQVIQSLIGLDPEGAIAVYHSVTSQIL